MIQTAIPAPTSARTALPTHGDLERAVSAYAEAVAADALLWAEVSDHQGNIPSHHKAQVEAQQRLRSQSFRAVMALVDTLLDAAGGAR